MSVRKLLEEMATSVAIGFAGRMAQQVDSHTDNTAANSTARQIGNHIADALATELFGDVLPGGIDQPGRPLKGELITNPGEPHDSGTEILAQQMAAWNHPAALTPEQIRALADYHAHLRHQDR